MADYKDAAYVISTLPEGQALLKHLRHRSEQHSLVKDKNGATDPMATAHALGWRDCVKYIERLVEHGELARKPE